MEGSPAVQAISFQNVSKYIARDGQKEKILDGITGVIQAGSLLTILGPSGSGKSSLLSLCNLLLSPDEGRVLIQNREVREWDIPTLRRKVGMVFQTPTMFPGSVHENLQLGTGLRGAQLPDPEKYLEQVGLSAGLLERDAAELSGGQKQRVALARTLVNDPDILLLDEITSALDPTAAKGIEELIARIHKEQQKTILWVTHDMEQAKRVGEITWIIDGGRLVEANRTELLFQSPREEVTRRFLAGELPGEDLP